MKTTKIFGLQKPEAADQAKPDPFNANADEIEGQLATFDRLANLYGVTETYPDADTGTITATVGSTSPVTATRQTVISKSGDTITYTETTTIDGVATVRTWTEGETTASMEVSDSE